MDQAVLFDVVFGNGQCVAGDINRIHFRFREGIGAGDGDTAAAGAHIQNMLRLMVNQAGEVIVNKLTNRRARHQHAFIHIEFMTAEPGFVSEVSHRNALVDAADHALNDAVLLAGGQARGTHIFRDIQRQIERRQHQLHGFVPGVVGTVTVPDVGGAEAADRPAQHVLNGMQLIHCFIDKNFIHYFLQGALAKFSAASLP